MNWTLIVWGVGGLLCAFLIGHAIGYARALRHARAIFEETLERRP